MILSNNFNRLITKIHNLRKYRVTGYLHFINIHNGNKVLNNRIFHILHTILKVTLLIQTIILSLNGISQSVLVVHMEIWDLLFSEIIGATIKKVKIGLINNKEEIEMILSLNLGNLKKCIKIISKMNKLFIFNQANQKKNCNN